VIPGRFSRYRFCGVYTDARGRKFFGPRPRFLYRDLPDNRMHPVREGDTLHRLAHRYFPGLGPPALDGEPRPAELFWVIGDFQPEPIFDATIRLERGGILIVPSVVTVESQILTDARLAMVEL
jgi:hypothetical protein